MIRKRNLAVAIIMFLPLLGSTPSYAQLTCLFGSSPECTFVAACKKLNTASACSCLWGLAKTAFPEEQHSLLAEIMKAGADKDDARTTLLMSGFGIQARMQQVYAAGQRQCKLPG
jgi:hypothetical protein